MKAPGFLRKLLGLHSVSGNDQEWSEKVHMEPIYTTEPTDTSTSQLTKKELSIKIPEPSTLTKDDCETMLSSLGVKPETIKISRQESKDSKATVIVGEFFHHERSDIQYGDGILRNTFIHLKGIGPQKEAALWEDGIMTHEDALDKNILATRRNCLRNSRHDIENRNFYQFYEGMSSKDHWRLFGDLIGETAYVDIETTGLTSSTDIITTAVVHSLRNTHVFVNGMNLEELPGHLSKFKLIITYNGKSFDIPFIERFFRTKIPAPHIDLRYVLSGLGYKGGLKSCEQQLRLPNRNGMEEIDGFTAVLLWNYYCKTKNPKSLETLLAYNYEDSVRLEWLMIEAYNKKVSGLPFNIHSLHKPRLPANPYRSHPDVLRRIL